MEGDRVLMGAGVWLAGNSDMEAVSLTTGVRAGAGAVWVGVEDQP